MISVQHLIIFDKNIYLSMNYFSKNLRHLRHLRNLSQEELARKIGMNRGNIASYEKGNAEPNINNLTKIGKFFNTDLNELIEKDLSFTNEVIMKIDHMEKGNNFPGDEAEEILKESLEDQKGAIEMFKRRSDEMARIFEGFRQFHKFRMENTDQLSEDVKKMALDYERLLDVLEEVLLTNKNIIKILDT